MIHILDGNLNITALDFLFVIGSGVSLDARQFLSPDYYIVVD
jgi:hypothetical protein